MVPEKEFNPHANDFHCGNAYWMARYSCVSYNRIVGRRISDSINDSHEWFEQLKREDSKIFHIEYFEQSNSQAILITHQKYYCMAFRGTDEGLDWWDNLNPFTWSGIHKGFLCSLNRIWDKIYKSYSLSNKEKKPLFLTGHSLGGAMAIIAALKLDKDKSEFAGIYTFGQPRVLKPIRAEEFSIKYGDRYFRINYEQDIVTRVPTRAQGFIHVGTYVHIFNDGRIRQNLKYWLNFIQDCPDAAKDLYKKGVPSVDDHKMKKYLYAIQNWNESKQKLNSLDTYSVYHSDEVQ